MGTRRFLTVGMMLDGDEQSDYVNDIMDRLRECPAGRDGVTVFAASWSNVFDENQKLEEKVEALERY